MLPERARCAHPATPSPRRAAIRSAKILFRLPGSPATPWQKHLFPNFSKPMNMFGMLFDGASYVSSPSDALSTPRCYPECENPFSLAREPVGRKAPFLPRPHILRLPAAPGSGLNVKYLRWRDRGFCIIPRRRGDPGGSRTAPTGREPIPRIPCRTWGPARFGWRKIRVLPKK